MLEFSCEDFSFLEVILMDKVLIRVSRQKIYESLLTTDMNYQTFKGLCAYAYYTPHIGLRLVIMRKETVQKQCWIENSIDLTVCLQGRNIYEITTSMALVLEKWIKLNKFYYYRPGIYSDYLKVH